MIRALVLALGLATPALAATPEEPEDPEEPEFSSAAVAGVFPSLPPGATSYPVDILLKIRVRLGGEPPEAPAEEAPAKDGH